MLSEILHSERIERLWKTQPLFEIALILTPGHEAWLADSIDSLAGQYYSGWRLCVFAPTDSPEPEFTENSEPVRWIRYAPENLVETLNRHLTASSADWFGFFDCGTRFSEDAFLTLGDYIAIRPQWRVIYTDDDCVASKDVFHSPRFKPDLSLEFLRATDYVGGFFIEKHALLASGGVSAIAGAERYDLLLRAIDALGETAIGHIPEVLVHLPVSLPLGARDEGATEALRQHFERRKTPVSILPGLIAGETRRVIYLHEEKPLVSIIIPTKNRLDLLVSCVESLLKKTFYPNWELLIVDNDSDDPEVHAYYGTLRERLPERVNILSVPGDFDFPAMNNRAARQAKGDYLLLLNNDTECLHGEWLDAMMSHAQRPDVGIVGARLLLPETLNIQHAGMILGMGGNGTAGHVFFNQPFGAPSYLHRAVTDQEYSAVTGACLLIRASIFHQVTGLDHLLKNQHQDVDLCLKVVELGYRVLWTPFATLIHHSSASLRHSYTQERMSAVYHETVRFITRWKHRFSRDPFWNHHLGLQNLVPRLEMEWRVPWNPDFNDRPRILLMPGSPAREEGRMIAPLRRLNADGRLHYAVPDPQSKRIPKFTELERMAPSALLIPLPTKEDVLKALLEYKELGSDILTICLLDDLPEDEWDCFDPRILGKAAKGARLALENAHRLIVRTEPQKAIFHELCNDIRVVPDALEGQAWEGLRHKQDRAGKPRIGWVCAKPHAVGLRFMPEVVKALHKEADWVFLGVMPEGLWPELAPCLAECHPEEGLNSKNWPEILTSLDLDMALAPLEINAFNEATGNLRLLEYGILGWPVLCTDIVPYQTGHPPVARLPNEAGAWIAAIRERLAAPEALAREGEALREWVRNNHLLENRLEAWLNALI